MKGISLRHLAYILLGIVAIATMWVVMTRGDTASSTEPTQSESIPAAISPQATTTAASDPYAELREQTGRLIETYYLLQPSDTATTLQQRVAQLGFAPKALQGLTYRVGTLSCGDKARLDARNPLVMRAVIDPNDIEVRPPDDQVPFAYATAHFVVGLFQQNGDAFEGTETCPTSMEIAAAATWQQEQDGSWTLLNFYGDEVTL